MTRDTIYDPSLALHGGRPVRDTNLPYGRQLIDDADVEAVIKVLRSDYLTTGPAVQAFEDRIATYTGAKYVVAFSNGTAALHGACFAAGIGPGDEVITTPITFAASANCVLYMGGTPVFADVDLTTYNIHPASIAQKITNRTKAILPVHFAGQPVDLDEIHAIAKQHGLFVIEDAAHALGASYRGVKIGNHSDMTVFSLHPVKPITTGEGGVVTTNNPELYDRLSLFRSHGITKDPHRYRENHGPWYHEMQSLGFNYRLTDIQAALGASQLDKLDPYIQLRNEIAATYTSALSHLDGVEVPFVKPDRVSGWHLYVLRLKLEALSADRREIYQALQAENIGVNVHYIPVYYHPYYQDLGYIKGLCPEAERLYEEIITLPLFPSMTEQDVSDVIDAVEKVIQHYSR